MFANYGGIEKFRNGARVVSEIYASLFRIAATNARSTASLSMHPSIAPFFHQAARYADASAIILDRGFMDFPKPEFNITNTAIDGKEVAVHEEDTAISPFLTLKHFVRDTNRNDPPLLIVAPMSGHYATLLRKTVEAAIPHHNVYITDWNNPRDVPLSEGDFGLDDYTLTIEQTLKHLAEKHRQRAHTVAVCQPTVPVLAASALMSAEQNPARPASLTLIGGPIDVEAAHSEVSVFPTSKKAEFENYKNHAIQTVPEPFDGAGRSVYMGYAQLMCFMAMNPDRHTETHIEIFKNLAKGTPESIAQAYKDMAFYDEYLAVMDMTEQFYIDTIERVFINRELAKGQMFIGDRHVNLSALDMPILTVEGRRDDIAPVGQTSAVHALLKGLSPQHQFSYVEDNAGHYGLFAGKVWETNIYPQLAAHIRNVDSAQGIEYSPVPKGKLIQPTQARFVTPYAKPPQRGLELAHSAA